MRDKQLKLLAKWTNLSEDIITTILQTRQNDWFDSDEFTGRYDDDFSFKLSLLPNGVIKCEQSHRMTSDSTYLIQLDGTYKDIS